MQIQGKKLSITKRWQPSNEVANIIFHLDFIKALTLLRLKWLDNKIKNYKNLQGNGLVGYSKKTRWVGQDRGGK